VLEKARREEEAAARRTFVESQKEALRACTWASLVALHGFAAVGALAVRRAKIAAAARSAMMPKCLVRLRRALRRARLRLQAGAMERPAVAVLKADKMLGLFSDAHLEHVVAELTP